MRSAESIKIDKSLIRLFNLAMDNLVKALRIKRKLTQSELAECCSVSRQTIIAIEKGVFSPSLALAYKLSRVLDYKLEDMYDFSPLDKEIIMPDQLKD